MNIAICDDEQDILERMRTFIRDYFAYHDLPLTQLMVYDCGQDLVIAIEQGKRFDVVFLDIEMPKLSGMDTAEAIRQLDSEVLLVFVTGHSHFVVHSFQVEAFDFLMKPLVDDDLAHVLKRCRKKLEQRDGQLLVKTTSGLVNIHLQHVVYIASDKHHVIFYLQDGSQVRTLASLSQIERRLAKYPLFARCHQSYLVNLNCVRTVSANEIHIRQQDRHIIATIPISRKYKASFREKFFFTRDMIL